jgi:hypothetical protein
MSRISNLDAEVKNLNLTLKATEKRTKEEKYELRKAFMEDTKKLATEYKSYRNLADMELKLNDNTIT